MADGLKILFVAAEAAPLAKVGGMGDVVGTLPKVLRAMGHDVRIFMPYYGFLPAKVAIPSKPVWAGKAMGQDVEVFQTTLPDSNVPVYLSGHASFAPTRTYGGDDESWRFTLFSRTCVEFSLSYWRPQVVHCHDWHTGMVPVWLHAEPDIATVFTIHNLAYQGPSREQLDAITPCPDYMEGVNVMSAALLFSDIVNTVSPTYAQQIQTAEYGESLEGLLSSISDKVTGILNGIDPKAFDPASDGKLTHNFSLQSLEKRQLNKASIQKEMGLPVDDSVFLIGMVSRLVEQKGLDLLMQVLDQFMAYTNVQFAVLGTGESDYEQGLLEVATRFPTRFAVYIMYSDAVARRIYAGADAFLMPSRFEPCGISQMIALRYGCIPLVRRTGGLVDTVIHHDPVAQVGTGYCFDRYEPLDLYTCMVRAWEGFQYKDAWRSLQRRAMVVDHSWDKSAQTYVQTYQKILVG